MIRALILARYTYFLCFALCDWQEVAVKEQLMGKGKLYRRSLSSPNVNRVSFPCWHLQQLHSLFTGAGVME